MKLRKRLLNRLARRLMRVAHAMDGEDVSPPIPPKYGDLRLNVNPADLDCAKRQWKLQEEARKRIENYRITVDANGEFSLLPLIKVEKEDSDEGGEKSSTGQFSENLSESNGEQDEAVDKSKSSKDDADADDGEDDNSKSEESAESMERESAGSVTEPKGKDETAEAKEKEDEVKSYEKKNSANNTEEEAMEKLNSTDIVMKDASNSGVDKEPEQSVKSEDNDVDMPDVENAVESVRVTAAGVDEEKQGETKEASEDEISPKGDNPDSAVGPIKSNELVGTPTPEQKSPAHNDGAKEVAKESAAEKETDKNDSANNASINENDSAKVEVNQPVNSSTCESSVEPDVDAKTGSEGGLDNTDNIKIECEVATSADPTAEQLTMHSPEPDGAKSSPAKTPTVGGSSPGKKLSAGETSKQKSLIELPPLRELSQLEKDYEILKDFVDAYEKEIDTITGEVSFRILNEGDREEDYVKITRGVGIGASFRGTMSLKEKEAEFTRWQTALLGRIPEAPTFDEIGMKNCVFMLDERRKLLQMEIENKRKRDRGQYEDSSDEEEEEKKKPVAKQEKNIGAVERKNPDKKDDDEKGARVTKRMKPLSLVPYPSFYESDLRRLRMVHFDLMTSNIQNSAKERLDGATNEYNAGKFRTFFCFASQATASESLTSFFASIHKLAILSI